MARSRYSSRDLELCPWGFLVRWWHLYNRSHSQAPQMIVQSTASSQPLFWRGQKQLRRRNLVLTLRTPADQVGAAKLLLPRRTHRTSLGTSNANGVGKPAERGPSSSTPRGGGTRIPTLRRAVPDDVQAPEATAERVECTMTSGLEQRDRRRLPRHHSACTYRLMHTDILRSCSYRLPVQYLFFRLKLCFRRHDNLGITTLVLVLFISH